MDDNVRNPKPQSEAKESMLFCCLTQLFQQTKEKYKSKDLVNVIIGQENALILSHKTNEQAFFGKGKESITTLLDGIVRQSLVAGFLKKILNHMVF